jgi:archaellum component FlaC
MNIAEKLSPALEEIGRQLVADELVPKWRPSNVQGSTEEKLQRLARWAAEESTAELAEIAARNAKGVLLALQGQVHDRVAAQLRDGGLPAAHGYLQDEATLWKAAQETLPLQGETAQRERERLAQELRDKLQAIRQLPLGLRGRRLNQSLNELVALRNQMSQKEAQQARWTAISMHLAEPMLNAISEEQEKLLRLEKQLGDLSLHLTAEAEELRQQLTTLDILEERVGSREDLVEYFAQAHVDLRPKLPQWLALTTDGVNRMIEETLEELKAVDQALAQHCLIQKRPDEFLRRIGQADRLAAPYANLAYDPDNAPTLMMLLTGYQGDVNLAEGIPQGVPVTASDSLQANEVILAQARSGIALEALAGLDEWRTAAQAMERRLPLYTIDPTVLEPL